ncbi:uncharacterized protein ACLA_031320 [Aspergillus clavatus NRRL 1]|uniref:Cytochrome b561 domain-containing protein n=1 Tax=Aspergillus clavatus (strain ATCC 1007 / CBS 513.65 / DSM 816 / NCTC 3887 / NRRL 1 / QM 1276 / 107) TaxID=344612 RepID=A1CRX8_ASPCL|nr:uncharacterized protein ACLA_031320 [Aspergillus clavatus NRRL 1]EAW08399.1 conserved hypothetical protein [Aspergillus clavatus NRRL 1]
MSNSDLTAPGSSTYASNTLHVGDGTWDSGRDTFLLPNLMGVNFETMQYNGGFNRGFWNGQVLLTFILGMGNRFRDMPHYRTMIIAHGVIATIVFLGLVPISVLLIRYYSRWNPFWAFKLHVWCQVLTLLLSTVVFVLGWFAVGPERSLTNPHHGIGLAIYVIVVFQVLWGYFVHRIESRRKRYRIPLKLVIHRWLGRALAILGIVQIPLGLTLYGSPKVLFILFSIAAFALLATFFVLSYLYDSEGAPAAGEYDAGHSYVSGPSAVEDRRHGSFGRMAAAGAAGAGLAELFRRRSRPKHRPEDSHVSYSEDKYSDAEPRREGWGNKFLKLGAIGGGALLAKRLFDRRRDRESDAESGRYSRAHTRSDSMTEATMSRLEDGRRPEPTYQTPLNRPPSRPPGGPASRPQSPGSSYLYNTTYMTDHEPEPSHKARNALFGVGAFAALKGLFNRRKRDNEQRRVEDMRRHDIEEERIARANSKRRHTGDGFYPRKHRRADSFTATDLSSTDMTRPPRGPSHGESAISVGPSVPPPVDGAHSDMPPAPPIHPGPVSDLPAPTRSRHELSEPGSALVAGAAMDGASSHRRHRSTSRRRDDNVESPPVSVKVKMHNDGRHVTLRRLTEEEVAASREARRRERRNSRRRAGSASSLSGNEGSYDRWRRVEELERQQQEQIQREQQAAAAAAAAGNSGVPPGTVPPASFVPPSMSHVPGPPPAPSSLPYGAGSITSPGTFTGTDASGDYANNRRRRRAERARARQERQQSSVDFT